MRRARNDEGKFVADDPTTPNKNEAYENGVGPKQENLKMEPKSALSSKGIWGSLLAILAAGALVWADFAGVELSGSTQSLLQGLAMCSGGLALWGRAKADGPVALTVTKKD